MTRIEFEAWIRVKVRGLSTYLDDLDYVEAVDSALEETGWSVPETNVSKIRWIKSRSLRHLFFSLMSESAHKFKFEQVNLQQRFEHYKVLIENMDKEFEKAQEEDPTLFAGVSTFKFFGTKIDAGFASDDLGRDVTYDKDRIVIHHPNESS